jgi:hypothetical protein
MLETRLGLKEPTRKTLLVVQAATYCWWMTILITCNRSPIYSGRAVDFYFDWDFRLYLSNHSVS